MMQPNVPRGGLGASGPSPPAGGSSYPSDRWVASKMRSEELALPCPTAQGKAKKPDGAGGRRNCPAPSGLPKVTFGTSASNAIRGWVARRGKGTGKEQLVVPSLCYLEGSTSDRHTSLSSRHLHAPDYGTRLLCRELKL